MKKVFLACLLVALLFVGGSVVAGFAADGVPSIHINRSAPPATAGGEGPMFPISGTVESAPSGTKVVIYCFAAQTWWIQPFADNYLTSIKGAAWNTSTHGGEKYAALLVRARSFKGGATLDGLPPVGGDVLAVDVVPGRR